MLVQRLYLVKEGIGKIIRAAHWFGKKKDPKYTISNNKIKKLFIFNYQEILSEYKRLASLYVSWTYQGEPSMYRRFSRSRQLGGLVPVFWLGVPLRYNSEHVWDQLLTIWNIGETGDIYYSIFWSSKNVILLAFYFENKLFKFF